MVKNFDHLNKLKVSTVQPTAFTERGLYMLATILKSERAARTTITILPERKGDVQGYDQPRWGRHSIGGGVNPRGGA